MWKIPEGEDDFVLIKSTDNVEWSFHSGYSDLESTL